MTGASFDPASLRVSDAERSHVLGLLERATGRGLIDLSEYVDRSAAVVTARTRGELNTVLIDLPALEIGGHPSAGAVAPGSVAPAQAGRVDRGSLETVPGSGSGVMYLVGWGSRSMRGNWTAPAHIVIGGFVATTRLDFSNAILTSRTVTVEIRGNTGGSVDLVVPTGATVSLDGLRMRGGSVSNRVLPGGGGVLDLALTGIKRGGWVVIRPQRRRLFSPLR